MKLGRLFRFATILLLARAALLTSPARGADIFAIVSYNQDIHIRIYGDIEVGDDLKFSNVAHKWASQGYWVGEIELKSFGGSVPAALNIGRQIRTMGASTRAPLLKNGIRRCSVGTRAHPQPASTYNPDTGEGDRSCDCVSACFLIWASGVGRYGNVLGVHSPRFDAKYFAGLSNEEAQTTYDSLTAKVKKYLTDMDVPEEVIAEMYANASNTYEYLDPATVKRMNNYPSYLNELRIARCGSPPRISNPPTQEQKDYNDCAYQIYADYARTSWQNYLKLYPN